MEYANFQTRLGAMVIDLAIMVMFGLITDWLVIYLVDEVWQRVISFLVSSTALWLYFALQESSRYQATIGKGLMGLVVTDMSGRRISFSRATGRHFGKYISGLTLLCGFIAAAFTHKRQALHDLMGGTLVLKQRP